ncbi:MAG: sialate O-acetylesterase [Sediminicola sp.]|jgi:sialate O-acetylesterase
MKTRLTLLLVVFCMELFASCSRKSVITLAPLFQDNMVLQQQSKVPIWGWAEPNSVINIYSSWNDKTITAKSDSTGKFTTNLETIGAGGPFQIEISSANKIVLENVMLGEVWLCSGQSNMEMPLKGWLPNDIIANSEEEISAANFPNIRLFNVPREISLSPQEKSGGSWKLCTPENAVDFSAVAFFFARNLNKELDVPIGLIQSTWGGTPVESWMPIGYAEKVERFANIRNDFKIEEKNELKYQQWIQGMEKYDFSNLRYSQMNDYMDSILPLINGFDENDKTWETHEIPKGFEAEFGNIDPIVWYRKEFIFNGDSSKEGYKLFLGPIDDLDATYLNGIKIGEDEGWQKDRIYNIQPKLLKDGKNVLAVRVLDNAGGGGIYKGDPSIKNENKVIVSLKGDWKYKMLGCFENPSTFRLFNKESNLKNRPKLLLNQQSPTVLYNAMIDPLIPYKIKGVIWYQGENNVWFPEEYAKSFPLLIDSWRDIWVQGDFSFYFVQIAPYNYNSNMNSMAAVLRESQRITMKLPNTGMVITSDIGDVDNIHPANKQDVGKRLALWAMNKTYGKKDVVYSGPLYKSIITEGNNIRVNFDNVGSGLFCPDTALTFFEIAGKDGKYYPAEARIDGEQVVVKSIKVKQPVHVRFGWTDTAIPNLFNKERLPAASFSSEMMGIEGNQESRRQTRNNE